MIGVGFIGSIFIEQIKDQSVYFKEKCGLEVWIVGMANSW